jgi:plastocyanin
VSEQRPFPVVAVALVSVAVVLLIAVPMIAMMTFGMNNHHRSKADAVATVIDDLEFTIEIPGYEFDPSNVSVPVGASITFENTHAARHNAKARDDSWGTEDLDKGESQTLTFDTPGTWEYICSIHPYMEGVLTVR